MELEQMKAAWQELDRRLERSEAVQLGLQRELSLDRTRSRLRRWLWLPGVELAISLLVGWWAGGFLGDTWALARTAPLGALPALVVLLLAWVSTVAALRQMVAVLSIDYAAPVLRIQRQLEQARILRIRLTQVGLLWWLPLWPVFVVFVVQWSLGFGLYRQFGGAWLWANTGFGLALAMGLVWLARRHGAALARRRPLRWLADSIAGSGLVAASAHMDELARFGRE